MKVCQSPTPRQGEKRQKGRKTRAVSLVETLCGFCLLLPLVLVAIDVATTVVVGQTNEQLAETAARAASTQRSLNRARKAAEDAISEYQTSSVVTSTTIEDIDYDLAKGRVAVTVAAELRLPVPVPFLNYSHMTLRANCVQPIVSIPAAR